VVALTNPLEDIQAWASNAFKKAHPWCEHLMIRVPSSSATRDNLVRRMCASGCGLVDFVDPDSDLLQWGPEYGKDYL
jgi:hypothetical protein